MDILGSCVESDTRDRLPKQHLSGILLEKKGRPKDTMKTTFPRERRVVNLEILDGGGAVEAQDRGRWRAFGTDRIRRPLTRDRRVTV